MTTTDGPMAHEDFTKTCFDCGRQVKVRKRQTKWHGCRLRLISRVRWTGYLEGWHEAHRFAVAHPDDPMVLADAEDYGSGWAAFMRRGGGSVEVLHD